MLPAHLLRPLRGALLTTSFILAALVAFAAAPAQALQFTLDHEFDGNVVGPHATVEVTESGGGLDFEVSLAGTDLGAGSDLHIFYFNLAGDPTNVTLSSTQVVNTPFTLAIDPQSVAGGAGSSFEYAVNFGDGASVNNGNGVLKTATFRITADEPLTLADLEVLSSTRRGILAHAALHVQGTSLVPGTDSETVGGVIPEPGTLLLLGTGLAGLAATSRKPRR